MKRSTNKFELGLFFSCASLAHPLLPLFVPVPSFLQKKKKKKWTAIFHSLRTRFAETENLSTVIGNEALITSVYRVSLFFSVFFSEIVFVVFFLFFFFFYREFPPQAGGGARPAEHPRYFPFARYRRRRSVGCCCLFTWWWWFIYLFILRWGVFFSLFPFSSSSSSSSSPIGRSPDEDIPCRDRPLSKREPPIRCAVLRGLGIQIKNQKKNI